MGRYAGVDWASEKHDVFVQDADGSRVLVQAFAHDERGLGALCGTLVRLGVELVTIERPDGLLVERLLDAGLRVMAIHPTKVHAARPRFRPAGGKSDAFDAFVLCELARTDNHRFRVLTLTAMRRRRCGRSPAPEKTLCRAESHSRTSCALNSSDSGPGRPASSLRSTVRSAWRSLSATPAPSMLVAWGRSAWPRSWHGTLTADARRPRSCSPDSGTLHRVSLAKRRSKPEGRSCLPLSLP